MAYHDENAPRANAVQPLAAEGERADQRGIRDRSQGRVKRALDFVRQQGPAGLLRLIKTHGIAGSTRFVLSNLRFLIAVRADRNFDRKHGVDTGGSIQIDYLDVVGQHREFGNEYVPTSPRSFDWMMKQLKFDVGDYTFIDFGAGKGRCLLLASRYAFARVIGVEFAKELCAIARANIRSFGSENRIQITETDATLFKFPEGPLLLYFYNPFGREVLSKVLDNLFASLRMSPRACSIVYASSSKDTLPWAAALITADGFFVEQDTTAMPLFFDAVRSINFAAFKYSGA